jgi:glutamate/tyrosine decarboxylase-like PLP-dependent enzyme
MGEVAERHGIPLHVDACVGGFILPFMEMNGAPLPPWDYRVPGVTSIAADLHKYGYGAKGASTITYRNLELLKHQMFVYQDWPGGIFASPALLGTRPGGAYAAAWAALQYFGRSGYRELARRTSQAFGTLRDGIQAIPELQVLGDPQGPLLSYGAREKGFSVYAVGDQLEARGWQVNRVQFPAGLHAMVTAKHLESVAAFLADLRAAVATVKADPSLAQTGSAATYGLLAKVPLRGVVRKRVLDVFANMYRAGGGELALGAADPAAGSAEDEPRPPAAKSWLERLALRLLS